MAAAAEQGRLVDLTNAHPRERHGHIDAKHRSALTTALHADRGERERVCPMPHPFNPPHAHPFKTSWPRRRPSTTRPTIAMPTIPARDIHTFNFSTHGEPAETGGDGRLRGRDGASVMRRHKPIHLIATLYNSRPRLQKTSWPRRRPSTTRPHNSDADNPLV